jgi:predicted membrane protein
MFALTILATGGQLLAAQVLDRELSFWAALWPVALIALGVTALFSKFSFFHLGCILFGGYFALGNWDLLPFSVTKGMVFPVILVLFGVSLLVDAAKKPKKRRISIKKPGSSQNNLQYGENGFTYSASFGEETQHIHMDKMEAGEINVSFGDFIVDLTGVEKVSKNCTLDISCSFGELVVLVPSRFEVKMNRSGAFSDSCVTGKPDPQPDGTIYLESSVSFGDLEVQYI